MKWQLSRINQGYEMTRISGNAIECRKLTRIEKILYWFQMKIQDFKYGKL